MEARLTTREEIAEFLVTAFPQTMCQVVEAANGASVVSREISRADLRPGGTVSGPVLMAVADVALYVATLSVIGIVPLTVTTSLNINFLRKPSSEARILGKCRLIKVGKALAVGEVALYSEDGPEMVAHAVGTYSIPPRRQAGEP